MYDVEAVSSKAEVLSVKDINRFFTVFLEKQSPISFIKICKNCTNLEVLYNLYITYYITYKSNYITFNIQKTKIKGN